MRAAPACFAGRNESGGGSEMDGNRRPDTQIVAQGIAAVVELAKTTINSLVLANGGAAIAILAFMGQVRIDEKAAVATRSMLTCGLYRRSGHHSYCRWAQLPIKLQVDGSISNRWTRSRRATLAKEPGAEPLGGFACCDGRSSIYGRHGTGRGRFPWTSWLDIARLSTARSEHARVARTDGEEYLCKGFHGVNSRPIV